MPTTYMTLKNVVDALVALLGTIDGIGIIHAQRRIVKNADDVQRWLYVDSQDRINGWMVSPAPTGTTSTVRNPGHAGIGVKGGGYNDMTTMAFQIEGWFGVNDEKNSEQTFRDLCGAVVVEINSYGGLTIPGLVHQDACNMVQFGYAVFANMYPLHYSNLRVSFTGRTHG